MRLANFLNTSHNDFDGLKFRLQLLRIILVMNLRKKGSHSQAGLAAVCSLNTTQLTILNEMKVTRKISHPGDSPSDYYVWDWDRDLSDEEVDYILSRTKEKKKPKS